VIFSINNIDIYAWLNSFSLDIVTYLFMITACFGGVFISFIEVYVYI